MKCPICGKDARVRIFYCARCTVYVHEACWRRHVEQSHKD